MSKLEKGFCNFCGEIRMVEVAEGATQEEVNAAVTDVCDCPVAEDMKKRAVQKQKCIQNINLLLTERHPDIAELFKGSIDAVQEHTIKKLTVNTYDNQTARMYECKDGIKVELERKRKEKNLA